MYSPPPPPPPPPPMLHTTIIPKVVLYLLPVKSFFEFKNKREFANPFF
eukprot:UN01690